MTAEWRDIVVVDSPPPDKKEVAPSLCIPLHSIEPALPFRIPHWLIGRLTQMGLELQQLRVRSKPVAGKPLLMMAQFIDISSVESIHIVLGTCMQSPGKRHWAKALVYCADNWDEAWNLWHDCHKDHVAAWPNWAKDFGVAERTVRLSFSSCKSTPEHTLVVHVELEGRVYNAMKKRTNVELPSREALGLGTDVSELLPPGRRISSRSSSCTTVSTLPPSLASSASSVYTGRIRGRICRLLPGSLAGGSRR